MKSSEVEPPLHEPVMVEEVLSQLEPWEKRKGTFLDGTTSTGGHTQQIAEELDPEGTLIGLDLDVAALEVASERLQELPPEVKLFRANYRDIDEALAKADLEAVDGILLDLGFSTFQVEDPKRGFSFQSGGPLDMRMNQEGVKTAEEVVNEYPFEELKDLILRYGEERWADGIASEIVETRKEKRISSTDQLVGVIESALPEGEKRNRNLHPATKTFQALRIEVNNELTNLEEGLKTGFGCLREGGVFVVISYHSLEDRRVKRFFNHKEKDCICPPDLPVCRCDKEKEARITAGGITPGEEEIERNPRARSARLRAAKKLGRS